MHLTCPSFETCSCRAEQGSRLCPPQDAGWVPRPKAVWLGEGQRSPLPPLLPHSPLTIADIFSLCPAPGCCQGSAQEADGPLGSLQVPPGAGAAASSGAGPVLVSPWTQPFV